MPPSSVPREPGPRAEAPPDAAADGALDYPFEAPPFGTLSEVAPGLGWARFPLPYAVGHVNVWIIEEEEGWVAVDCGLHSPETEALWDALLAGPLADRPLRLLIGTHGHSDHVGHAGPLCLRTGAAFLCPRTEWLSARYRRSESARTLLPAAEAFYGRNGWPEDDYLRILEQQETARERFAPLPAHYRRLADGQRLTFGARSWSVATSGGHSPEHAVLLAEADGLLIAGDHLLPEIVPPIGVAMHEPHENPLADYFAELVRLESLGDGLLVLPSHGRPYRGLSRRVAQLRRYHGRRLGQILACAAAPRTAYEICHEVFARSVARGHGWIAFGQTVSCLNYLFAQGLIERREAGGRVRYVASREAGSGADEAIPGAAFAPDLASTSPMRVRTTSGE